MHKGNRKLFGSVKRDTYISAPNVYTIHEASNSLFIRVNDSIKQKRTTSCLWHIHDNNDFLVAKFSSADLFYPIEKRKNGRTMLYECHTGCYNADSKCQRNTTKANPVGILKMVFFAFIKISAKVYIPHHICIIVCNFRLFI